MANSQDRTFLPLPRILTRGGFVLFAILAILCCSNIAMADLVTYWTFNENAFSDASGNNCSYEIKGNSPIITDNGKYGKTFYGNSSGKSGGKCNINVSAANVNLNNFSISFWGKQTGANWKDYIGLYASGDIQFQRADNSLDIYGFPWGGISGLNLNLSSGFHHFVLTTDSTTGDANLYIDNVCVKTLNKTDVDTVISHITLGGAFNPGNRNGTFTVDEVQFYNQPLTAEQVSFLYNNPSLYLATGYQRDVTADGNWSDSVWNANQLTDQAFANSSAVQLDAENSPTLTLDKNVTVNSLDFNGSMTIDGSNTITLNGEKRITVAGADDVVTISAPISPLYDNTFTKTGAGTLVFTEANAYTGNPTVSDGTLRLTDNAVTANGVITLEADDTLGTKGTLEYNVASGEKTLIFSNAASVIGNGDILKTGEGRLKINTEQLTGDLHFTADNFVVASGPVDIKGYMYCNLSVEGPDAVFSPGNSIGNATFGGGFILKEGATLLIEQDETGIDTLTASSFNIDSQSIIDIVADSLNPGAEYPIIVNSSGDFGEVGGVDYSDSSFWNGLLTPSSDYYWNLSVRGDTVYASVDANAVPEPSTWALLLLGAAGLLYVRKRTRK